MLASGIIKPFPTSRAVYQYEIDDDDPSIHDEEDGYLDDNFAPDSIDMSSDDIYNVHNNNFKRTPHAKSLIPRRSPGKSKPHKATPPEPRYNGTVYLAKHIYNMLREGIKKELDKHSQDKKAQYKPTCSRMAKVHEQDQKRLMIALITQNLTWKAISKKNLILCKILTLSIFWNLILHILSMWHPHTIT